MLALAEPDLFSFIKHHLDTFKRGAFHFSMIIVAKRSFFSQAATAPGVNFAGFNDDTNRLTVCHFREAYIGDQVHGIYLYFTQRVSRKGAKIRKDAKSV